jgi:DNA polymerase V
MKEELVTKKMIATTRMFGRAVTDLKEIKEAVATYTSRAAEKLRRQHSAASVLSVFVVAKEESRQASFHRGTTLSSYIILPKATSSTHELIKPALELAEKIFQSGRTYKKAGVVLSGIVADSSIQGNLFETASTNSQRKLMDMIDNVNFSQRDDVLKFAASGTKRNWKMRHEMRSKRYTTRWNELYEIK